MAGSRRLTLVLAALQLAAYRTAATVDPEGSTDGVNMTALREHCYTLRAEIQTKLSYWESDRIEDYLAVFQTGASMEPTFKHREVTRGDREVVVNHGAEDVHYVQQLVDAGLPMKIRQESGGDESIAYVQHMIDSYDSNRKLFAFIRGDPDKVMEAPLGLFKYLADQIDPAKVNEWGGYASLNHAYHKKPESAQYKLLEYRMDCSWRDDYWVKYLKKKWSIPEFGGFAGKGGRYCCSQFAITRESLRAHPKEFYESLMERLTVDFAWQAGSWKSFGTTMSVLWHVIFTGRINEPKYTYADVGSCPEGVCVADKHRKK